MTVKSTLDLSGWERGLDKLAGPLREQLASSMAVAGGKVLRDEAKLLAPRDSGLLASSIYLARKDGKSNESRVVYSVTWNGRKAPHGHLVEFGTVKMAAKPFLRPAYDIAKTFAMQQMIRRGRERLPELLAGGGDESGV